MNIVPRGYLYGFAAYLLWGLAPLYFKLLQPSSPVEILAHRIVWSVAFIAVILLIMRSWRSLRLLLRRPRQLALASVAAVLIAVNWGTYIFGVNSDRVVEVSLGYFILPLVSVLLGVLVLGERLGRWQWVAVGCGSVAVCLLAVDYGRLPYVALILAGTFGVYGLIKKQLGVPAAEGLFLETSLLMGPALAVIGWLAAQGSMTVGAHGGVHTGLILAAGVVTAVPLLLFAGAANRIPLSTLGILQYLAPVLQFGLGVFVFGEAMPPTRWVGFALVWLALVIFTADAMARHRRGRAPVAAPAVVEPVR